MLEVNEATFDKEVTDHEGSVMVYFSAPWCQPCKMMGPVVEKLSKDFVGRVKFVKVNLDENQYLATRFHVRGLPTFAVMKNGNVVDMLSGAKSPNAFKAFVDSNA